MQWIDGWTNAVMDESIGTLGIFPENTLSLPEVVVITFVFGMNVFLFLMCID